MKNPKIAENVYIAPGAKISGDVTIGENCSVFFNAVIRGDVDAITIGRFTNIQDNCVLHSSMNLPISIGDRVTVGHSAIVHGCTIGDNVLIGMGSIIMNGVEIGSNSVIAAGSIVTEGKKIEPYSLVMGAPGKVVRSLSEEHCAAVEKAAMGYDKLRGLHLSGEFGVVEGE